MNEKVRVSFQPSFQDDPSPMVVIYNPSILPMSLFSQLTRFGLTGGKGQKPLLSGKFKGSKPDDITMMIQSYGLGVELVPGS